MFGKTQPPLVGYARQMLAETYLQAVASSEAKMLGIKVPDTQAPDFLEAILVGRQVTNSNDVVLNRRLETAVSDPFCPMELVRVRVTLLAVKERALGKVDTVAPTVSEKEVILCLSLEKLLRGYLSAQARKRIQIC